MLKRIFTYILIVFLMLGFCVIPSGADEKTADPSSVNGCHGLDAAAPYLGNGLLMENLQSAFLYEINSDSLLYAWNADTPQYPASLVKIMTALLVLENAELTDVVTVSESALETVSSDAISADLVAGEQITVQDLMYCMLVKSANDAAAVLAEYVFGSQQAFVDKMNARALELGCTGTTYINPHGLHEDQQVTTARDTCRILLAALEYEAFQDIFGTVHYTVSPTNLSEERFLSTNNFLMNTEPVGIYLDERVTGGRTGVTTEGFRCIASTAESGNMEVICIVMGCASTFLENSTAVDVYGGFPETITLLDRAFDGNAMRQIIFENQILKQQTVLNGDSDVFILSPDSFSAVLPSDYELDRLTFQYTEAPGSTQAPISKGQLMGTLQVMQGSTCIAQTEVFAANDVSVAVSKTGSYIDPADTGGWWAIILVVLVIIVAAVFVMLWLRFKKRRDHRAGESRWRRA